MNKIETEDIKELFAEWGLWSLIDDVSPDGDGHGDNLQLTKEGLEAERMINLLLSDQSQKQQEGETIRNYNPEKRWDKYKKSKIEVREFDLVPKVQPEKQEGWRELSVNTRRILKTLGYYFSDGNEHYSCPVCGIDVVRLDQLLSERTFSKEELRLLNAYLSLALPEYNNFDKGTKMYKDMKKLHKISEKISKLKDSK